MNTKFRMEASQDLPSQQPIPEQPVSPVGMLPAKKSRRPFVIVGCVLLVGLCLCLSICGIYFGSTIYQSIAERDNVAAVIDKFMVAMAAKDTNQAYALFSTRARRQFAISKLEDMIDGSNYALFDGYGKVEVLNINLGNYLNTNPDAPQGLVAKVDGKVTYRGGFAGTFQAVLEKEGDEWKLNSINVVVPPNKLEEFLQDNP